jgi:hypothetical protein
MLNVLVVYLCFSFRTRAARYAFATSSLTCSNSMTSDFSKSYFELFKLPVTYKIDAARLEAAYREVQSRVHPDRFVSASEAERRRSMQWATHANEAYTTLKKPLARARYLVKLNGVDTEEETNRRRNQYGDARGFPYATDGVARGDCDSKGRFRFGCLAGAYAKAFV